MRPGPVIALLLLFACVSRSEVLTVEGHTNAVFADLLQVVSGASDGTSDKPRDSGDEPPGPERLQQELRVTLETNAPTASAAGTNDPQRIHLKAAWQDWNGLFLELSTSTGLTNTKAMLGAAFAGSNAFARLRLEQVKLTARIGGRFAVDGAGYLTSGDLTGYDAGVQLRRARITLSGDCILLLPVSYQVQLAYNPNQFSLEESYLLFRNVRWLGSLKLGEFQAPMGLDMITSSRDIPFMEPAAPLQALAPGNLAGIQVGGPVLDERMTWALGLFAQGTDNEYGVASQDFGSVIGRVTWLPLWEPATEAAAKPRFLHLGASGNLIYSATSSTRYRSRPESYLAPYVIDTGALDSSSAATLAGEVAWVNGPLSLQAEILHTFVATESGPRLDFGGGYAFASLFLTGESRPYDPRRGKFTRVIPHRNFRFHGGGGAWEIQCRFSHTDLTDGPVSGGRLDLLMAGVNWYLHPHLKWMFNYGFGRVSGTGQEGNLNIFQTRLEVDF
jgi:phosphate-selective porin OprO/OprP